MADTKPNSNISLPQTHQANPNHEPLLHALDRISLILNQNSNSENPFPLRLALVDSFVLERGPNYTAYAELRESRLHMKCLMQDRQQKAQVSEPTIKPATPPRKKQVKFQTCERTSKGSFSIAQSVPDFSAALRKENRKPVNTLPSMTPPSKSGNRVVLSSRESKSVSGGEKKKGGGGGSVMARKSYACIDELKGLSSATAIAINGEGRGGGRSNKVMGKTVSRFPRQF
ncbi:hypothetical protein LR48_Vigan10g202600 [Vigna angularis]|uniref:Uncharacterized protein n=2 Tax=Phaseolus angularis TaxID=3914 RepID=A0A0L9VN15_PHAAN|nr:uncharacterized protein LOC108345248 [Vigna angularis]KAG2384337.1 uncharacterized protein HKW66_Vig0148990 [Vigna angularis]KOM56134.1 hypothetical protein LR48_Vigan10g202600 [Vigna angularis]BAU01638.1 hypothetical protein VIGAN_11091100 [Vigna angularis var. angularis]